MLSFVMILVTGATGKLGRLVVQSLLQRVPRSQIVAGARDLGRARAVVPPELAVRTLDYDRPSSLAAALHGIERVLLISGAGPSRVAQHAAVITAAAAAGVRLLAYTSGTRADTSPMKIMADHKATEAHLRASGVPHAILRNDWYVENYVENAGPVLQHGVMSGAAGEGRVSVAPRADYAEAAAAVLATDGHEDQVYELGGDRAVSLAEIAAELGRVSGKRIEYRDMAEDDYTTFLVQIGVPEPYARLLSDADTGIKDGHLQCDSGDLRRLLGRPTTPLPTAIERALRAC